MLDRPTGEVIGGARPWSFTWSLSESISGDLRAPQSRSHASRDPRTGPGRGSSPVSPTDERGRAKRQQRRAVLAVSASYPWSSAGYQNRAWRTSGAQLENPRVRGRGAWVVTNERVAQAVGSGFTR